MSATFVEILLGTIGGLSPFFEISDKFHVSGVVFFQIVCFISCIALSYAHFKKKKTHEEDLGKKGDKGQQKSNKTYYITMGIVLLSFALTFFLPAQYQTTEPEKVESSPAVPITTLSKISDTNDGIQNEDVMIGTWTDAFHISHPQSIRFWVAKLENYSNTENIIFNLNEEYNQIKIHAAFAEDAPANATAQVKIVGDGKEIYFVDLPDNTRKTDADTVSVSNVRELCVECSTDYPNFVYCIADIKVR